MREKEMKSLYFREMFAAIGVYLLVLFSVTAWIKDMPDSVMKTALALSPALPVVLMFWAILRHVARMDAYLRGWLMENIAIAGGITAMFSVTYGFLEGVGYPRISMWVVWSIFMGGTGIVTCVRKWMEK
ncbi:hypothetical protein [Undibacterium crateris]|uniref:hypothetical protein n=1 Tax=Undibacterium crateris TaxID=2528175 RepID=UPI00138A2FD5|nr:hypothetical protein [Undibacterium crateris]NDI87113.1 hypothetical protein [Undibacterium crateris]